jgi:hypothetical protein
MKDCNVYVTMMCLCGNEVTDYYCHFEKGGDRVCFGTICKECEQQVFHQFTKCPYSECKFRVQCLGWPQSEIKKIRYS